MTAQHCSCAKPVPVERSERKGAARTECGRCGLPVKIAFGRRAAASSA
jgi:hypothetical protein